MWRVWDLRNPRNFFMWVPANVVPAMPKGREDNTHLNVYGARVIAGLTVDAIASVVPELANTCAITIM